MNRQKKKVNHSSEDEVSIFDSEEEEDNRHKKKENKENKEKSIRKSGRGNEKVKRSHHKIREKKLVKEEESIMKQLMGKD